jgi:hypothetical protein
MLARQTPFEESEIFGGMDQLPYWLSPQFIPQSGTSFPFWRCLISKPSRFLETAVAARAAKLDAETALEGDTTVSLETQDMAESDILLYVRNNFVDFHRNIQFLSNEDQDLLLGYYVVGKTQAQLAAVLDTTQTICSSKIGAAIERLCFFIICGPPTAETLKPIFEGAGVEHGGLKVPLSEVVAFYAQRRSFYRVAKQFNLRPPDVRRAIRAASKVLSASNDHREKATGAYLSGLFDKARSQRQKRSTGEEVFEEPRVKLPEIFGQFRVDVRHPDFDQVFAPRGKP